MSAAAPSGCRSRDWPPLKPQSRRRCQPRRSLGEGGSILDLLGGGLRGVKTKPRVPGALPVLFFGPALGFEVAEIGRRICPFAEVAGGIKRIVDPPALHLGAVKLVTNPIIVWRSAEPAFQLLERSARSNSRKR